MGSFHKNIQLMLDFLNAPLMVSHFSYHTAMNLLIISVMLLSMLMILLCTLQSLKFAKAYNSCCGFCQGNRGFFSICLGIKIAVANIFSRHALFIFCQTKLFQNFVKLLKKSLYNLSAMLFFQTLKKKEMGHNQMVLFSSFIAWSNFRFAVFYIVRNRFIFILSECVLV